MKGAGIGLLGLAAMVSGVAFGQAPPAPTVTKLTEPQDDYPDLSPDGRRILFQSNRSGRWQLWEMASDGSQLARVTSNAANDRQPAWSPDGRFVAYSSDDGMTAGKRAILVMPWPPSESLPPRRLTSGEGQDVHPKWLRDGSGLVFNRISADGKQADVHIVTLDGAERKIPLGPGLNTYASVAGTRLIYRGTTTEEGRDGTFENSDIFSANLDGSRKTRLTDDPAFDGWPAISPDGTTIAFASRRGGDKFRVFLMPINGGTAREVTAPAGYNYTQPAWARDGKSLIVYRWVADSAGEVGHLVRVTL